MKYYISIQVNEKDFADASKEAWKYVHGKMKSNPVGKNIPAGDKFKVHHTKAGKVIVNYRLIMTNLKDSVK